MLGLDLRRWREMKGGVWSQGKIAQVHGCSRPYVCKVESGQARVTRGMLDVYLRHVIPPEEHQTALRRWYVEASASASMSIFVTAADCYAVPEEWGVAECHEWLTGQSSGLVAIGATVERPIWMSTVLGNNE